MLGKRRLGREQTARWLDWLDTGLVPALAAFGHADLPAGRFGQQRPLLLEVLELDFHLSKRAFMSGPAVRGGLLSFADVGVLATLHAHWPALAPVLWQAPHVQRWMARMQILEAMQPVMCALGQPVDAAPTTAPPGLAAGYAVEFGLHMHDTQAEGASAAAQRLARQQVLAATLPRLAHVAVEYDTLPAQQLAATGHDDAFTDGTYPAQLDPAAGDLNPARARRKRQQIQNMLAAVRQVVHPGHVVVEFGAGGGHLGLFLAFHLPDCYVVLVDRNLMSLARAQRRFSEMGLRNVETFIGDVADFAHPFDVGVALHFCGPLTDLAHEKCLQARAAYVLCPCCYGKTGTPWDGRVLAPIAFPRSQHVRALLTADEHRAVAAGADCGSIALRDAADPASEHNLDTPEAQRARRCMGLVDLDRNCRAQVRGRDARRRRRKR